jgi:hypothetical protein
LDTQRLNPSAPSLPSLTSRRRLVGGALATILAGRSTTAHAVVEPDSTGTGILPRPGGPAKAAPAMRPNVVLIVLDDMDVGAVAFMPNVQELLADQGATFVNFFDTTPACGPSRASILRGQYAHNHGVLRNNNGEDGGFESFHALESEESTLATWLHDAGYRTALIGKYMNGYAEKVEHTYVPRAGTSSTPP